ncbi:MAG: hypothetical protein K2X27_00085, partial [Candidatus Obscuribacterales bacterium]|nr:hypothetical protein [Candidatus Obscuribacterales bacterium]
PVQAAEKIYDLDLRNANDLSRSHLLHRLQILNLPWGQTEELSGKSGTFHELWRLRWMPEFSLSVIEAGVWGRTVEEAASAFACNLSDKAGELSVLTKLLDQVLLANLKNAVGYIMQRLENEAALSVDIKHLMAAVPALLQIARYGNVRKTDSSSVSKILDGMLSRICVGLPSACNSLSDEAAQEIFALIMNLHSSLSILQNAAYEESWYEALGRLIDSPSINGLIAGRACRLLFERKILDGAEAARRFSLALSTANDPAAAASFADGFLRGSGLVLIHDDSLFEVVDDWVKSLNSDAFTQILPLLRRTFSSYVPAERRQIGGRVAKSLGFEGPHLKKGLLRNTQLDTKRAEKVLPVLASYLGLELDLEPVK